MTKSVCSQRHDIVTRNPVYSLLLMVFDALYLYMDD